MTESSAPKGEMPTLPDTGLQAALTLALTTLNDALDYLYNPFEPDNQSRTYIRIKGNCEKIRALAATSAAQAASGGAVAWIPVSERLPGIDDVVLVYAPDDKYFKTSVDEWGERRECPVDFSTVSVVVGEGWASHEFEEVTHWMPLPAAPDHPSPSREGPSDLEIKEAVELVCWWAECDGSSCSSERLKKAAQIVRAAMKEHQP